MIPVSGEALIDLFAGPPEGTEMPARAVAGGAPNPPPQGRPETPASGVREMVSDQV